MRPLSLQSIRAIGRQPGLRLHPISRRALTSSPICLEESKTETGAESERQKGVPLATELGGISINKTAQGPARRLSLLERLAARRSQQDKTTRTAPAGSKPSVTSEKRGQRGDYAERASSDQRRRPFTNSSEAGGARRSGGNDRASADRQGKTAQAGRGGKPRSPGQGNSSSQARQGGAKPRMDGRGQGHSQGHGQGQRQGQRGPANASSPRRKTQGRPNNKARPINGRSRRSTDPELNDYPNAEGRNPPPVRRYDAQGLLILKGDHAQISPVIPPQLPKFEPLPITPRKSGRAMQTVSYLDRAPPKSAADPSRNVLGVVDNAELALSRVRQLDVQQRRDALAIVQKMVGSPSSTGKEPTASA